MTRGFFSMETATKATWASPKLTSIESIFLRKVAAIVSPVPFSSLLMTVAAIENFSLTTKSKFALKAPEGAGGSI
jgi:hypothetical protein